MKLVTYMHEIKKSLTAYNFSYKCPRDQIALPVDQKYEIYHDNEKIFEKTIHNYDCGSIKRFYYNGLFMVLLLKHYLWIQYTIGMVSIGFRIATKGP